MSRVREISGPAELAGLRLPWNALLPQTRGANFFQSLDWLEVYWRNQTGRERLRVLVVYSGSEAVGILPLVVKRQPLNRARLRVLTFPLVDWGSFYGPIGPNPTATLLAAMNHVARGKRDWDLLELPGIDADGVDHGRTQLALENAGLRSRTETWRETELVDLAAYGCWDNYLHSHAGSWRDALRDARGQLSELGELTFLRYRPQGTACGDDDPRWDWLEQCEQIVALDRQSNQSALATLFPAPAKSLLHDAHEAATKAGALDLGLLVSAGRPIAFQYAYHYRGSVYGLLYGCQRRAGALGAAAVLQSCLIEDSFARGDHTYDLGLGYRQQRQAWHTQRRVAYRCTHIPTELSLAQAVRIKRGIMRWADSWLRKA